MIRFCDECGLPLNNEEIEYYETRCEQCEREWLEDITAWRKGAKNDKFDKLYSIARILN